MRLSHYSRKSHIKRHRLNKKTMLPSTRTMLSTTAHNNHQNSLKNILFSVQPKLRREPNAPAPLIANFSPHMYFADFYCQTQVRFNLTGLPLSIIL